MQISPVDEQYMAIALEEARAAMEEGEVPIGAVITRGREILSRAHNRPIGIRDPSAHAEILAMRAAALALDNYRIPGTTLYVTVEPCIMCAAAIAQARIERLVFGARDAKGGGIVSLYHLFEEGKVNHRLAVSEGVMRDACAEILSGFFREKRITSPPLIKR